MRRQGCVPIAAYSLAPVVRSGAIALARALLGWKLMGAGFVLYSLVAGGGFSLFYALAEQFPPLWPQLAHMPLAASVLGALFVGAGVGLCVRAGGAPGGDDALAMSIAHLTGWNIRWPYLLSDLIVLLLSLSYIPLERMGYSLLTVILSGQLIGFVQSVGTRAGRSPSA